MKTLETVFAEIGWLIDEKDYPAEVAKARATLSNPEAHPSRKETAARIVAAADGLPSPASQFSAGAFSEDHGTVAVAAAGSDAAIILGTTAGGREVSLADVEKEGLALFASLAKYTDVGASARDMMQELATERAAKAAGLAKMPDLPALRAAITNGIARWTGSPWQHSVDEGIRAEIANLATLAHDHEHTHGTLGLPAYPKGPGQARRLRSRGAPRESEGSARRRSCRGRRGARYRPGPPEGA